MGQPIELIVGLGNPGPEYQATRHNAGFWFVDLLADRTGATFRNDRKLEAQIGDCAFAGQRIRLLKPMTYMNHSGQAVSRTLGYFRIPAERMLVVYDEIDLPAGRAKLRFGGGHAGHNGLRSVIQHAGPDFWRIRLGVGHPGDRERVVGHVLRSASAEEEQLILNTVSDAIDAAALLIEQGEQAAMQSLHSRRLPAASDIDGGQPGAGPSDSKRDD